MTFLDLSAVFDTLDHRFLFARWHDMLDTSGKAFVRLSSYLSQAVSVNGRVSSQKKLHYVVLQGSVLGPILFTLYIQPLSEVISKSR